MKTSNTKKWNAPIMCFIVFLVFICALFIQYCYLSLFPNIYGINMQEFSSKRNTYSSALYSKRGTIYDKDANILAIDVSSYTVIAYLDESRTGSSKVLYHVKDKQATAEALSPLLNMSVESLMNLLSKDAYQVELGPGGRDITEITKAKIQELNLPGIDFVESYKRYYPNGDFASYIVGYAKRKEVVSDDGTKTEMIIEGELGTESNFDEILKGVNGYTKYQQDRYGYKIPDTKEEKKDAIDGADIYLTLDANIQRIVEGAVKQAAEKDKPDWITLNVMDAKTGDILASSSTPSYDPNILNITNYEDPLTSFVYEPGSVMKIFTYMCTMEKGNYKGDEQYQSGNITVEDSTIYDWNKTGWGTLSYDNGFRLSSNVGVVNLVQNKIGKEDLKSCLEKYGFGKKTEIELPRELTGSVVFNYPVEVAAAAYGQGISTTPVQILQALSMIANKGKMVKPNIISKIVASNGDVLQERQVTPSEAIISENTVNYLKELMFNTVNMNDSTGYGYRVEGLDVIGKTGTAEVFDEKTGGYSTVWNNKIYSFAGMFPKEDPQIIIFVSVKKPATGSTSSIIGLTQPVIESIGKYLGLISNNTSPNTTTKVTLPSYISQNIKDVTDSLTSQGIKTVVLGSGDKIIDQYPAQNTSILTTDTVYLLTNGELKMPNLIGYTRIDAITVLRLMGIDYTMEGNGYVKKQSINAQDPINDTVNLILEPKYDIKKKKE